MKTAQWLMPVLMMALAACDNTEQTFMVGTLERDRVEVSTESNEPIISIAVRDGQMLEAGDLILRQDPTRLKNILRQKIALRDQAEARLAELQRGPRPELIREARAQVEAARAQAQNAVANLKRAQEVFARNLSDQATLDLATTHRKTTAATEQAANETLERLLNGTTTEELQQAAAALEAANAGASQTRLDIERLDIHTPVDGILDKRLYQLGERPKPGAIVAIVLDTARTYARIYVPEPLRASMQPGRQLDVRVDGENRTLRGTVSWVSTDATFTPYFALTEHDRSRLSYLAEIDLSDASSLPSGLPLEVDFPATVQGND